MPSDADPADDPVASPAVAGRWAGWAAPALVFFTSAAILVLEILAGRLVAPYVGVSLETYSGIIGTVLAGMAIGSAIGGRAADRHDPRGLLGPLLIGGGVASLLALPIIAALGPSVAESDATSGGIIVLAVAAFVLPTSLLSAVSPMVTKLRLVSTTETGSVVGALSSAGTAGALAGTFLTGFVLVSALPTRPIILVVGGALVLLGLAVTLGERRRPTVLGLVASLLAGTVVAVTPTPCQRETAYYCVSVERDPARAAGRVLYLDNLRHSYVDLLDPTYLEFRYTRLFAHVVDRTLGAGDLEALHIGGGGFTFPRWLLATRPGTRNTVLELDPTVLRIAKDELGLVVGPQLGVRTGDARTNIRDEPTAAYDLVVGDAFGGLSAPWHLTTVEMIDEVHRTLRPGGFYVLNVIDAGPQRLVRAELASLARVFEHVALIAPPTGPAGNHVLVASDRRLDLETVDPDMGRTITGPALADFVGDARPLTDDHAPVDQLITRS